MPRRGPISELSHNKKGPDVAKSQACRVRTYSCETLKNAFKPLRDTGHPVIASKYGEMGRRRRRFRGGGQRGSYWAAELRLNTIRQTRGLLIRRAKRGDQRAFEALYRSQCRQGLCVMSMTSNVSEAEGYLGFHPGLEPVVEVPKATALSPTPDHTVLR